MIVLLATSLSIDDTFTPLKRDNNNNDLPDYFYDRQKWEKKLKSNYDYQSSVESEYEQESQSQGDKFTTDSMKDNQENKD